MNSVREEGTDIRITNAAQARIHELSNLRDGKLTSREVLQDARDPQSPLHECFEWDNNAAAERWRERQASILIKSVKLVVHYETTRVVCPAFVRDPEAPPNQQGMISVARIATKRDLALETIRTEIRRLQAGVERLAGLAEVLQVADAVEALVDHIEILKLRIEREERRAA